jgi:hypothetical protein
MSLFPNEDILTKEIESWKGFADSLRAEDNELFAKMLNDIYKYVAAINAKGRPFPTEPLLMALLLKQQKTRRSFHFIVNSYTSSEISRRDH